MIRSFSLILSKASTTSSARKVPANAIRFSSSNIVRFGVDVLPTMSQAVVHNGIVYLSGQIDGEADDVTGQTKNILAKVDKYLAEAGTDKSKLLTSSK